MKIYTKSGDDGSTGLQGGKRVSKSNIRISAYGTIDELNSSLGLVLSKNIDEDLRSILTKIQNELFIAGSDLSNPDIAISSQKITNEMIIFLEKKIDEFESEISPLTNFILPGGNPIASQIHFSRTIARRAERKIVNLSEDEKINPNCQRYVNRLSDLLFVMGRVVNHRTKTPDVIWKP